jgi:hypothetical protein
MANARKHPAEKLGFGRKHAPGQGQGEGMRERETGRESCCYCSPPVGRRVSSGAKRASTIRVEFVWRCESSCWVRAGGTRSTLRLSYPNPPEVQVTSTGRQALDKKAEKKRKGNGKTPNLAGLASHLTKPTVSCPNNSGQLVSSPPPPGSHRQICTMPAQYNLGPTHTILPPYHTLNPVSSWLLRRRPRRRCYRNPYKHLRWGNSPPAFPRSRLRR